VKKLPVNPKDLVNKYLSFVHGDKSEEDIHSLLDFFPSLDDPIGEERGAIVLEGINGEDYRSYMPLVLHYLLRDSPHDSYFVESFLNRPKNEYLMLNKVSDEFIGGYSALNRWPSTPWISPCLTRFSESEIFSIIAVLELILAEVIPRKNYQYNIESVESLIRMLKAAVVM
jgi:hypothetical protein